MTETRYVTYHNPAAFFKAVAEEIQQGFYADESVEGYPHFDILNEVKLTKTDTPSIRHDLSGFKEVHITSWHNSLFMLDYQDAVLQGFEVVPDSIKLGDPHTPHSLVMKPAVSSSKASTSDDMLDALAVGLDALQNAPKEPTEAPVENTTRRKGGRPPKIKEL